MPERELLAVLREVVLDVHDQASLLATVEHSPQPTPDHLLIEHLAEHRTGDVQRADGGRVEAGGEDAVVGQPPDAPGLELGDVVPPRAAIRPAGNGFAPIRAQNVLFLTGNLPSASGF
jgi:hypothetical protein